MQDETGGDAAATMPIRLRTSLPGCSIPYVPYMVPVNWRRSQLSTLVNKVLQTADNERATVPFDFIVDGELLRTSLDEYLAQHGRSSEETLELEYIRSTLPPSFKDAAKQDDWVAGLDARHPSLTLAASYDGNVRIWNTEALADEPATYAPAYAHGSASLTSAQWLEPGTSVVTGAMDGTVAVWRRPGTDAQMHQVLQAAELRHHVGPVTNVDVAPEGSPATVLSAGWDGSIAIWDVPRDAAFPLASGETSSKKRRVRHGDQSVGTEAVQAPPPTVVLAHVPATLGASAAKVLGTTPAPGNNARTTARLQGTHVFSAAWDGSVKLWDLTQGGAVGEKASDKVHLCLDVLHGSAARAQAVTGHMDHSLGLYDFRDPTKHTALAIGHAHAAPISAVRTHPTSSYLLASGAYDGRIKVWDVRSPKQALFALSHPHDVSGAARKTHAKMLALDWTRDGNGIVAGGEDCRVSRYQGAAIGDEHL